MAAGPVLVVDFGAQYAQLIARRVREANVYSELVPHSMPVDELLAKDPQAIILSGGPASVFEPGAPRVDKKLFEAGVPVLGICYGFQAFVNLNLPIITPFLWITLSMGIATVKKYTVHKVK